MASTSGPTQSGAIFTGRSEQLLEARGYGLQAHLGIRLALGTAEVASQDQAGALFQGILNGGQRRLDALVAGDFLTPGASGTLKSTRMKTRLPFRSRSRIDSLAI